MVCAQMGVLAFVSSSALAMVEALQLSPTAFSVLFAAVMLGQIVGGVLGARLVSRLGSARLVRLGAAMIAGSGALLAALALAGAPHWTAVVLPMVVYLFGCSFIIPNATAAALSPFPLMAGSRRPCWARFPIGLGALLSAGLAAAFDGSTRPMAFAIGLFEDLRVPFGKVLLQTTSHG